MHRRYPAVTKSSPPPPAPSSGEKDPLKMTLKEWSASLVGSMADNLNRKHPTPDEGSKEGVTPRAKTIDSKHHPK